MDEDLKIIISSELEADEQASANRISAQLPSIAKLINSKSTIKVGVSLDEKSALSDVSTITKNVERQMAKSNLRMDVDVDAGKISEMADRLESLNVPTGAINEFKDNIKKANIRVTDIASSFDAVNNNVTAVVSGIDQFGAAVRLVQGIKFGVDEETGEVVYKLNKDLVDYHQNIEKIAQSEARRAAQEKRNNELRAASLNELQSKLDSVKAGYSDINTPGAIKREDSLNALNEKYDSLIERINTLRKMSGKLSPVDESEIKAEIRSLESLVKAYKNLESAGTKLRKKDVDAIKSDQESSLNTFEQKLKNAGALTEDLKDRISSLRTELSGTSDAGGIRTFLDGFDKLKGDAGTLIEKLRGVNDAFNRLADIEKKIGSAEVDLAKLRLDPSKNQESISEMEAYLAKQKESKALVESEIASYGELAKSASRASVVERERIESAHKLAMTQAEISAAAREADKSMKAFPMTLSDMESRFRQVVEPTKTLVDNMNELRSTEIKYASAKTNEKKAEVWERTKNLIADCKREISDLSRAQRSDILEFKFAQDIEKAKADLETVKRQWSALFSDENLKRSFSELSASINSINGYDPVAFKKWSIEFRRFNSEVKAAGKNVMSFTDTLKNNIAKVLQWANATTILYATLRKLKEASSIVVGLDTAMIDLKKTTDETEETYRSFYLSANKTAKHLGVTTEAVISQTAEWTRLGMSLKDAATMAENSAIFKAISPEMDISTATDGLVSVMKAFGLEADEMLDGVISKINKIGNELPVSNLDIINVLTRSSAAMDAANNSLEQTIALATAGVAITRDADGMGNALKTKICLYVQKCA